MRDLADRLRAIVRLDGAVRTRPDSSPGLRELTYVPDVSSDRGLDVDRLAADLGGVRHGVPGSACVVVDRHWEPWRSHGRRSVADYALGTGDDLVVLDPRLRASAVEALRRVVFFDIETTGLSGGAGIVAFLAGCGWFEADGTFSVRQMLLAGLAGEPAMLDLLARLVGDASLLVTYNGRSFDVPVMEMRWAFHRQPAATDDVPHLDLLPAARRLWGGRSGATPDDDAALDGAIEATPSRCTLVALERAILGFHRVDDVPGFEIPTRYFQLLRTGDPRTIAGVLDHNRHDIVSLAAVTCHAMRLVRDGAASCADDGERVGLGRLYERAGDVERARLAYELTSRADRDARRQAAGRLAVLMNRAGQFDQAADAWREVLSLALRGPYGPLERRAAEALAIHHEHRVRDLETARQYASALERDGRARSHARTVDEAARRLNRLGRKATRRDAGADRETVPLLDDPRR